MALLRVAGGGRTAARMLAAPAAASCCGDCTIRAVVAAAGLTVEDLDLVVLHQANVRILDAAAEQLGIDRSKMFVNLDRYGNTSAGSIPLALDEAMQAGRIQPGDRVLVSGFGAGLTWGTVIIEW